MRRPLQSRADRGLKLTEAGKSFYRDAKSIIGYCRESVDRARAAAQREENGIRIGTSPMTPAQSMADLWPRIRERCPDVRFQVVPFENTPENAREPSRTVRRFLQAVSGVMKRLPLGTAAANITAIKGPWLPPDQNDRHSDDFRRTGRGSVF